MDKILQRIPGIITLAVLVVMPAQAQEKWTWPEKPSNLQVLPKDWPGSRLAPVMTYFTRALGVRCSYCHKGEEAKPLFTYDFPSDENANKNRAREMIRMLGSINDHLKKIEPSGSKRVNMSCETCHHGRPRPTTLEESSDRRSAGSMRCRRKPPRRSSLLRGRFIHHRLRFLLIHRQQPLIKLGLRRQHWFVAQNHVEKLQLRSVPAQDQQADRQRRGEHQPDRTQSVVQNAADTRIASDETPVWVPYNHGSTA